jgi:hypothetical protein
VCKMHCKSPGQAPPFRALPLFLDASVRLQGDRKIPTRFNMLVLLIPQSPQQTHPKRRSSGICGERSGLHPSSKSGQPTICPGGSMPKHYGVRYQRCGFSPQSFDMAIGHTKETGWHRSRFPVVKPVIVVAGRVLVTSCVIGVPGVPLTVGVQRISYASAPPTDTRTM